jgi:hypothetical protein
VTAIVHTYYEPVSGMSEAHQRREIEVWRASWERHGWQTRVLGPEDYQRTPEGRAIARALEANGFPSVNPPGYDLQCFLRWVALWQVDGGLMTDYDVVNLGYTPAEHAERIAGRELVEFCAYRTPAMLYLREAMAWGLVRLFLAYQPDARDVDHLGRPHVSDMTILKRRDFGYTLLPAAAVCVEADALMGDEKVIHVSHHAAQALVKFDLLGFMTDWPRWQIMEWFARAAANRSSR